MQPGDLIPALREPGRYHVRCLMVNYGFVAWLVLSGTHEGRLISSVGTGHADERRDRVTLLDLLPPETER